MGRFSLALVAGALTWLSATPTVDACPAGSPCLKYRQRQQTVNIAPEYFARADGGSIPKFDRKKLARYLAGARWAPVYSDAYGIYAKNPYYRVTYVKDTTRLRFIDATAKIPTPGKSERVVIVREIERNSEGDVFVDVDGTAFQLWYCVSKKGAQPCLTTTGASFYSMFPASDGVASSLSNNDSDLDVPALKHLPY
jgi:hypothetical protein